MCWVAFTSDPIVFMSTFSGKVDKGQSTICVFGGALGKWLLTAASQSFQETISGSTWYILSPADLPASAPMSSLCIRAPISFERDVTQVFLPTLKWLSLSGWHTSPGAALPSPPLFEKSGPGDRVGFKH